MSISISYEEISRVEFLISNIRGRENQLRPLKRLTLYSNGNHFRITLRVTVLSFTSMPRSHMRWRDPLVDTTYYRYFFWSVFSFFFSEWHIYLNESVPNRIQVFPAS
uniref:Uncharacterized protein n=1 Tax=Cacopsylla melanoneura TaxID=428564 RepID=A0A8D8ZER7_9HEMI